MSGYREKQGGRVLCWYLGCGLISLPGTGEAPGGAICQAARSAHPRDSLLLTFNLAGPHHAQEALVSSCSHFLMDTQLPGSQAGLVYLGMGSRKLAGSSGQ